MMCTRAETAFKACGNIYRRSRQPLKVNPNTQFCIPFHNFPVSHFSTTATSLAPNTKKLPSERVYNVIPKPRNIVSEKQRKEYDAIFPIIVRDAIEPHKDVPEAYAYYENVLNQNVPNHQQASGPVTSTAFQAFASTDRLTRENIFLGHILGWCVDLSTCYLKIVDDMLDGAETRRGLPCWYKNEDVGIRAVNDALFIENCVFDILKKYFSKNKEFYTSAVELLHELNMAVITCQTLDFVANDHRSNIEEFTMKRYKLMGDYAVTRPVCYLPVLLGVTFAGKHDPTLHKAIRSILDEVGFFFRAQNDVLDIYGDPLVTGKIGSDIKNGKCTWFICRALEKANPEQRVALKHHFGKEDMESVKIVKEVFDNMVLFEEFLEYEEKSFDSLNSRLRNMPKDFPQEYFLKYVGSIYGREVSC